MEIKLSEKISFPIESIVPSVDISQIDNYSHFSAVRLAKKYFEKLGFFVAEGSDFEDNLCLYFYEKERLFYDEYIKVKLGKPHVTDAKKEYCNDVLDAIPEADIHLLLVLCRFCSYTGAPGFPDLVIEKNGEWKLTYILFDEFSDSQKIFLMLCRITGFDVKIVRLSMEKKEEILEIDPFILLNSVINDRRARNIIQGLEENISDAKAKTDSLTGVEKKSWEDEFNYLSDEKFKNSLFLLRKWKQQGFASTSSLKGAIHFVLTHNRNDFDGYLKDLRNDPSFALIGGKTEDAMKAKAEYMQKKFGIGQTKSKLLLNFF